MNFKDRRIARMNALNNAIGFYKAKPFWIKWFIKVEDILNIANKFLDYIYEDEINLDEEEVGEDENPFS